jgi:hypothetical protein
MSQTVGVIEREDWGMFIIPVPSQPACLRIREAMRVLGIQAAETRRQKEGFAPNALLVFMKLPQWEYDYADTKPSVCVI